MRFFKLTSAVSLLAIVCTCSSKKIQTYDFFSDIDRADPPIADANPLVRHDTTITILTRISSRINKDSVIFYFDSSSFEKINTTIGENMLICQITKTSMPSFFDASKMKELTTNVDRGETVTMTYGRAGSLDSQLTGKELCRIPISDIQNSNIRIEMEIFETDIPPHRRPWNPRSAKFRQLWSDTLRIRDFFNYKDSDFYTD